MNWKHEYEIRQHPDFVDYEFPARSYALFAVVTSHASASDVERKKLFSDYTSRLVFDTMFDFGIDSTGVLKACVSRRPIRNMQISTHPVIMSDAKLLTLADSNKQFKKNLIPEETHLWETLCHWNLPVLVLGKFPARTVDRFQSVLKPDDPAPPFIVRTFSPYYMATKATDKQKKKFKQALQRFALQVDEWHRQNTKKIARSKTSSTASLRNSSKSKKTRSKT